MRPHPPPRPQLPANRGQSCTKSNHTRQDNPHTRLGQVGLPRLLGPRRAALLVALAAAAAVPRPNMHVVLHVVAERRELALAPALAGAGDDAAHGAAAAATAGGLDGQAAKHLLGQAPGRLLLVGRLLRTRRSRVWQPRGTQRLAAWRERQRLGGSFSSVTREGGEVGGAGDRAAEVRRRGACEAALPGPIWSRTPALGSAHAWLCAAGVWPRPHPDGAPPRVARQARGARTCLASLRASFSRAAASLASRSAASLQWLNRGMGQRERRAFNVVACSLPHPRRPCLAPAPHPSRAHAPGSLLRLPCPPHGTPTPHPQGPCLAPHLRTSRTRTWPPPTPPLPIPGAPAPRPPEPKPRTRTWPPSPPRAPPSPPPSPPPFAP